MARLVRIYILGGSAIALALVVAFGFWPRPLTPMALSYRAPLYRGLTEGERIELKTRSDFSPLLEATVPKPRAAWLPGLSQDLAIIISGLVGDVDDGLNFLMVEDVVKSGASVIILPSPTHWSFAVRRLTKDHRTQYAASVTALCETYHELREAKSIEAVLGQKDPRRVYLIGLSLGARHAISMATCFEKTKSQVLVYAVNPPTDLHYAGQAIDNLTARFGTNRGKAYSTGVLMSLVKPIAAYVDINLALRPLSLFSDRLADLAAASFSSRMEQLESEQETFFDGLGTRRSDFTFQTYMNEGPTSLKDFIGEIKRTRKITGDHLYFLHSRDDFLIREKDLEPIAKILGSKATIVDVGGHGGLIFEPIYRELLIGMLKAK